MHFGGRMERKTLEETRLCLEASSSGCIINQKSDCGSVAFKYFIQFLLLKDQIHHASMETKHGAEDLSVSSGLC